MQNARPQGKKEVHPKSSPLRPRPHGAPAWPGRAGMSVLLLVRQRSDALPGDTALRDTVAFIVWS